LGAGHKLAPFLFLSLKERIALEELIDSYVKLKTQEWESYCRDLSDWERQNALDF
jgi:glutamine synthetase